MKDDIIEYDENTRITIFRNKNTIRATRDLGCGVVKMFAGNIKDDIVEYEVDMLDLPIIADTIYPIYSSCKLKDVDKVIKEELMELWI